MKRTKTLVLFLCGAILWAGCSTMSNTAKGGVIGGGAGAGVGAIIGGIIGKGKGAAIGAAIGTAVGAGTGVIIGKKMDKKAEEAAKIEGAQVETVTDNNGLAAVKVSFESGILFGFNSSTLSNTSKASLRQLADILKSDGATDIAIIGHTDKVGTHDANVKVSKDRAYSVENYLQSCGVSPAQFKEVTGVAYDQYDETKTADQNRRVEVYMYASEKMIQEAQAQGK
ncbi:MAG: OmpA family protein [Prevotellaceae bacterium]|jgi:outer membrane protein OmpA-like peptidoglycan-associated protein|nr:OmpA family protein [Prevotellaceae bacterium]